MTSDSVPSAKNAQCRRAQGTYKRRQRDSVVKRDGKQCHYCGVETVKPRFSGDNTDRVRTVDHVVPLSAGGSNRLDNLVIACGWCNNAKADGHLDAQAIETRRAETCTGSVHESAVGETDAPESTLTNIYNHAAEVFAPLPGIPDAPGQHAGTRAIEPSEGDKR